MRACKLACVLILCLVSARVFAQKQQLENIANAYQAERTAAEQRIQAFLKKTSEARISTVQDGSVMILVDVSPNGIPIYEKTFNAEVATSLNVDQLRTGGDLGIDVEGEGIQIAIWDGGKVRNDHVELVGRVAQKDGATTLDAHATHVLGTMIAAGVNASAKGMAPKATAIAFDFDGDVSEMSAQAKPDQTSIILSNHSYGTVSGWDASTGSWVWHGDASISNTIDWKFGFYDSKSNFYDGIAYNAPYYLIVKSAGNDNNDVGDGSRPKDCNPFDCIPTNGVAKNILTVGAVKKLTGPYTGPSDVQITTFSSFGPTDDGRIKPDIVTPGQDVFSLCSGGTTCYTTFSGTSMSSPAATGTLALLQDLYKSLNGGNLMKAATLKALALHSAREAGDNPGPDYKFGWGMMDAEAAAKIIINRDNQNIFIEEQTLSNTGVFELNLSPKQNTKIKATLVWTDPAGTPQTPSLNPTTKMLVNDLDLRLVDDGGTTQFPWVLNPTNPSAAATKADNSRDNVEQLVFDTPEPRNYKLKVSHKGALVNGSQNFSLIVEYTSIVDPRISYYWIGNSGDWSNGANWSLSSGGAPAGSVPDQTNNVIFDENSFSANNQTLSLSQNESCYLIRWFANESINLSLNSHTLTVSDEINLLSGNISSSSSGTIVLNGNASTDAIVNLNSNALDDISMKFAGTNAIWNLSGNFSLDALELTGGALTITDSEFKLNSLTSTGADAKSLNLVNTSIQGINTFNMDVSSIDLTMDNSSIEILPAPATQILNLGTTDFQGSVDLSGGEVTIQGSGLINKITGFGTVNLVGSHPINELLLTDGSALEIEQGSTQTLLTDFSLQATESNPVQLKSSGALPATLSFNFHKKICMDHLKVENVNVQGASIVNAGANSTVTSSLNWFQTSCTAILFADFTVQYNCEKASVFFTDKSSGPITSRVWDFGDVNSSLNQSTLTSPIHYFEAAGDHQVTLEISDGVNTNSYSQLVQQQTSALAENKIEINNGKMISFLPANEYQWVLNGELIPNSNKRSIDFTNGLGEYAVLTFDDVCNRQSDLFLVTGVDHIATKETSFSVYPNPTSDNLFVGSPDGSLIRSVRLIDQVGRAILSEATQSNTVLQLNVSGIHPGVYILQIQSERATFTEKVVIR